MRPALALLCALCCAAAFAQNPKETKDAKGRVPDIPVPTRLWAAQTSPTEVTLIWTGDSRIKQYEIYAEGEKGDHRRLGPAAGNASTYVARLEPGRTNRFFIVASDNAYRSGEIAFNEVVPAAPQGEKPTPPARVIARSEPGRVTLTWPAVPGATAYVIGRAVKPNGFRRLCVLCPNSTSFIDEDVAPGAEITYSIAAVTPYGASRPTNSNMVRPAGAKDRVDAKAGASQEPPLPRGLWAAQTSPTEATLTWTGDPRATAYVVHDESRAIGKLPGNEQSYIAPLKPGVVNRFFLEARAGDIASEKLAFNEVMPASSDGKPPAPPASVSATFEPRAPRTITLSWPAVQNATAYTIHRTLGNGPPEQLCRLCPAATTFVDNNAVLGERHVYTVATVSAGGTSKPAQSNAVQLPGEKDALPDPKARVEPLPDPKERIDAKGRPRPDEKKLP